MLIQFNTPTNLNGEELVAELNAIGVEVTNRPLIDENKNLWLNIAESDKDKATPIVAAHNGTVIAPDTATVKAALLARLGITAEEAALLLGGN
jgi:hypothetical protein